MPTNIDDYIHRIGRCGRCGNKGKAVAFIDEDCGISEDLLNLMRKHNQKVPDWFTDFCKYKPKKTLNYKKKPYKKYFNN
jgi:ATP-dependent RNA helicase DDX3X